MSTRTEYPDFRNNQGKFLKVNPTETNALWDVVDASDIEGVLGIDHGGTGADNAADALNNLLPDQTSHAGEVLHTDGTDPYWAPDIAGGVQSVTGLDTDNSDPLNPIVQIAVDGVTVTGDGTPGNPLSSTGGAGGVDTRVYSTGASSVGFNPALGFRYAGLAGIIGDTTEAKVQATFGENVIVKRVIVQLSTGTINDDVLLTLRKNGVDTLTVMTIPALSATQVISFDVNESYAASDLYSIKIQSSGTGSLVFQNFETVVQVSGGTPLGVQSVTGSGVNNTDPFNPIVRTANTTTEGTLTAADWNTFNNKQNALPTLCVVKAYKNLLGGAASPFIADTEVFDPTSSYDNTTGIFTAPRTGYYLVTGSFAIESHSADPSSAAVQVIKNGSTGVDQDSVRFDGTEAGSPFWKRRVRVSTTVQLNAAETIQFNVSVNTGTIGVTGGVEGNQITITELR